MGSRRLEEYYSEKVFWRRNAFLDDNGDGKGVGADWFKGLGEKQALMGRLWMVPERNKST